MLHIKTDESVWDYEGKDNFIVLPITSFVRSDGALVFVDPVSKEASEKFPDLQKRWGYFVTNNVVPPTYRTKTINLIGYMDRSHYASRPTEEIIEDSLYSLNEKSSDNPSYVFYLFGPLGGPDYLEHHKRILKSDRIVLLEREENDEQDSNLRNLQEGIRKEEPEGSPA